MTKKNKIIIAIVVLVMIALLSAAFFMVVQKNNKKEDSAVEILNTLELGERQKVKAISVNSEQNILIMNIDTIMTGIKEEDIIIYSIGEDGSYFFGDEKMLPDYMISIKKKGKFQSPVALNTNGYLINNIVCGESNTVYFRGYCSNEIEEGEFNSITKEKLFTARIEGNELTEVKEIDVSDENTYVEVCDVRENKVLMRCSEIKKEVMEIDGSEQEYLYAVTDYKYYMGTWKEGEITEKEEITGMNSLYIDSSVCFGDSTEQVIVRPNDESNQTFLFDISDRKWDKSAELKLDDLKKDSQEIDALTVSDDGKTVYYALADGSLCRAGYDKMQEIEADTQNVKRNTSYDEYDTSDFELTLRNKSDKSLKQGVYYEIFVRSFADSDGDGIGDFNGVTAKLDYLKELGVDGIWLMPINQSPSYHGYDITDYFSLNEDYGTEEDFERLLTEAHNRGIKVIMDFPINHTSSSHPWFIEASTNEFSEYRNYYRWVLLEDTTDFNLYDMSNWGSEVWHKSGYAYYYGIFSPDMPDLNYNNEKVREEVKNAAAKWLNLGVDGFRLDAAMHIYGDNEFKQQESNLESNIQWWNEFASYCETINPNVYLVGEAWQNDEVLAEYVQPFDTKFNFSFEENMMESIISGTALTKNGENLSELLEKILEEYKRVDENYLDGVFGTNHDQDRIMSQTENVDKARLAAAIYMTLPGNPFIYYGEEIGMSGAKPDENIRTPFIWSKSGDMNTSWEEDSQNEDTPSLEEQMADENSMYYFYKKLIAVRKNNDALLNGDYTAVKTDNSNVMAYIRESEGQKLLVIHNLSEETTSVNISGYELGAVLYESSIGSMPDENTISISGISTMIVEVK